MRKIIKSILLIIYIFNVIISVNTLIAGIIYTSQYDISEAVSSFPPYYSARLSIFFILIFNLLLYWYISYGIIPSKYNIILLILVIWDTHFNAIAFPIHEILFIVIQVILILVLLVRYLLLKKQDRI